MTRAVRSHAVPVSAVLAFIAALALSAAVPVHAGDDVSPDVLTKAQPNAAPAAPNDRAAAQPKSDEPAEQPKGDEPDASASTAAEKLFGAIVKVTTRSVPDARSADSLGEAREGTGVVIARDGLVLTIGYLVVEADDIKVTDAKGRVYPANVVANDQSSGFALVRTAVPIDATPIEFGDSGKTTEREPVMIANAGGEGPSFAFIVSKRPFTGSWEYRLDSALFTSPPTSDWSGAALIDREGKLLGIGSLIVREATEGERTLPGNVFVPIDLLKPILADLVRQGRRAGPARPWLGISADELQGHLLVTKVSPDGPGDRAGIEPGDIIVAVGPDVVRSQDEFYERLWARRQAGDEVPLKVLKGAEIRDITVHSMDRLAYYRPRPAI